MSDMTTNILILCTGNSCRSHIAEGILRDIASDMFDVHSAGSNPAGYVHPKAIAALAEIGIDISSHYSKHLDEFRNLDIHTVITVCGNVAQTCPVFSGQAARHHWGFEDPAQFEGSEEDTFEMFRKVRDQIKLVFTAYASGYREALSLRNADWGTEQAHR